MKRLIKVLSAIKIFFFICLLGSFALATDTCPTSPGGTNGSGPLGESGPKVCGMSSNIYSGFALVGLLFILGITGVILAYLSYGSKANGLKSKSASYESELDQLPMSVTGGEARLVEPSGASKSVALKPGSNSIGRDDNQDIQVNDPKVSKKHADLNISPQGKYVVTDMNSQNGTFVNGARISQKELYQGDQIQVGDSRIIV